MHDRRAVGRQVVHHHVHLEHRFNAGLDLAEKRDEIRSAVPWLASRQDSFSSTGVRDATGRAGDFSGHQLEGRIRYWLVPQRLQFEFDGLVLSKGRFLRDAPNATAGRWTRYASFNLSAIF